MVQIVLIEKGTHNHIAHFSMGNAPLEISIVFPKNDRISIHDFHADSDDFKTRLFQQAGFLKDRDEYYFMEV